MIESPLACYLDICIACNQCSIVLSDDTTYVSGMLAMQLVPVDFGFKKPVMTANMFSFR